jgi:tetratricopeptide (TPR) repeat protein
MAWAALPRARAAPSRQRGHHAATSWRAGTSVGARRQASMAGFTGTRDRGIASCYRRAGAALRTMSAVVAQGAIMQVGKVLVFLAVAAAAATAHAAGGGGSDSPSGNWSSAGKAEDPAVKTARSAIAAGDYASAQMALKVALAADTNNADLHNLYAYSMRKGASPDMALVFKHYNEALRIDPKHRGAQEYIGEAYLMVGNLPKAKEHLEALNKICFFGCDEYTMLKKAIADYEARPK